MSQLSLRLNWKTNWKKTDWLISLMYNYLLAANCLKYINSWFYKAIRKIYHKQIIIFSSNCSWPYNDLIELKIKENKKTLWNCLTILLKIYGLVVNFN
jgi:hypothetical protein